MEGVACATVLERGGMWLCEGSGNVCFRANYLQTLWRLHVSANMAWAGLEGLISVGQTFLFCGGKVFF